MSEDAFIELLEKRYKVLRKQAKEKLIEVSEKGFPVMLANSLVVLAAFIPFFAVKELGRVLGRDKIAALFFRRRENQ